MIPRLTQTYDLTQFLKHFNSRDLKCKKCAYVYGPAGSGKTTLVKSVLSSMNYDTIQYGAGDTRNKSIMDSISINNMTSTNILSCFAQSQKKLVIIMDDIDCMNNGDRGGINSLIKLIRPKKTKRQQSEDSTHIPIICIGNASQDKKIKELMKYSVAIELKQPTVAEMEWLVRSTVPLYISSAYKITDLNYVNQLHILKSNHYTGNVESVLCMNRHEESKDIVKRIFNDPSTSSAPINDANRTIISLMWHENVIDVLEHLPRAVSFPLYMDILNEICFADFIDRITFQKQLWIFNELSFQLKPFYTNFLLQQVNKHKHKIKDVRFTKVLTKYSTEYNNSGFIQKLCSELAMDKQDLFVHLQLLAKSYSDVDIAAMYANTNITLLDIQRIYRYIQKNKS